MSDCPLSIGSRSHQENLFRIVDSPIHWQTGILSLSRPAVFPDCREDFPGTAVHYLVVQCPAAQHPAAQCPVVHYLVVRRPAVHYRVSRNRAVALSPFQNLTHFLILTYQKYLDR